MALQNDTLRLVRPAAGATAAYRIDADSMKLGLEFTPDPNAVQKVGQNLEFSFEDGGKVVLEGYYDHFISKTLPVMVTETGDELPGEQFLASLNEDLLTAAGPSASSAGAAGSGMNEYADGAGSLVDGIGRLDSLGTDQWARSTELGPDSTNTTTTLASGLGDSGTVTPPATPPVVPPVTPEPPVTPPVTPEHPVTPPVAPEFPATPPVAPELPVAPPEAPEPPVPPIDLGVRYDARAVMYTKGNEDSASGDAYTLTFKGLAVTGITWKDATYENYFIASYDGDVLTLTLTDAGRAALGESAGNLYNYLTLTTTEGIDYTVQVIVNQDDVLDSAMENARSVDETGGSIADGGLAHGEWHEGRNFDADGNALDSSGLGDTITFTHGISATDAHSTSINTHINEGREATITLGDDSERPYIAMNTASGGRNTIAGADGKVESGATDVFVNASDVGMKAEGSGSANTIQQVRDMEIRSGNRGMSASDSGTNTVSDAGSVTVNAQTTGMQAESGGKNIFQRIVDAVKIFATDGDGMKATGSGSANTIDQIGDVEIRAGGSGMSATNTGSNTINAEDTVILAAKGATATGMSAENKGQNTVSSGGSVSVETASSTGKAYGMFAASSGTNTTEGESVVIRTNIDADGSISKNAGGTPTAGTSFGLYATTSGSNTVEATDVEIRTGTTTSHAQGINASGGSNTVIADTVMIDAQSQTKGSAAVGGSASGMAADSGSNTIKAATQVDISAQSTERNAYGLHAQAGTNTIDAAEAEVTINARSGSGNAYGLYAPGGKNIITADNLEINAASDKGTAYGLSAENKGTNTIQGTGSAGIEVQISVTAGTGAKAFAMYAKGTGSSNAIIGSSSAADSTSDHITIVGNIKAESGGTNTITTGSGDNRITIDGDISGLTLKTSGHNTIDLTGSVTSKGLTFVAGAGHQNADLLILRGSSLADFQNKFGNWLKGLGELTTIETVQVFAPENMTYAESVIFLAKIQTFFATEDQSKVELVDSDGSPFVDPDAPSAAPFAAAAAFEASGHEDSLMAAAAAPAAAGDEHLHVTGSVDGTVDLGAGHSTLQVDAGLTGGHVASASGSNDIHIQGGMEGDSSIALAGSGNDTVHIDGTMQDGVIDLGNGDNSLHLGGIYGGTVTLGDGNDTVILSGVMDGGSIDLGDGNDTMYLSNILYGGDINGGEGLDTLNVSNFEALDFNQLIMGVDSIKVADFEVLDLTGGTGTTLSLSNTDVAALAKIEATMSDKLSSGDLLDVNNTSLDSYLSNNGDAAILRIHGDAGDTVNLTGWNADGAVKVDDIDYNVFRVEQGGEEHYLLVQQTIITATS